MVKYDSKEIAESFFAHKKINIRTKTGLQKAKAFISKAKWQDMFLGERFESLEWCELDEKAGKKRLKLIRDYVNSL